MPLLNEAWNIGKVVAIIGIAHDDELAPYCLDARPQSIAIPT